MINYAPIIDTSVPGFLIKTDKEASMVTVYFKHNIAVSKNEVSKMKVIIKPYSSISQTTIIAEAETKGIDTNHSYHDLDKGKLVINPFVVLDGYIFEEGVYYKIQIAYVDKYDNVGPYSSVGIARCLGKKGETGLSIEDLEFGDSKINAPKRSYIGRFNHDTSITENIYQYRFYLKNNSTKKIIKDTGWLTPINDSNNESIMIFDVPDELEIDQLYKLYFEIITVNGYQTSIEYNIKGIVRDYPNTYNELIVLSQNTDAIENGYIIIALEPRNGAYQGNDIVSGPDTPNGNFYLLRRKVGSNIWENLTKFSLTQLSNLKKFIWKDFSIEAGKTYIYAVQQYYEDPNTKQIMYSDKVISQKPITAVFENMFLSDGERQLAIKFDPKVSSLKTTTSETKIDTLGSKYPFFSRNGSISYKEIPISGLISYHMDPNSLFLVNNELGLINQDEYRVITKTSQYQAEENFDVLISGLKINNYNENFIYYNGNIKKENISISAYRFYFWDIDNPDKNLSEHYWTPPRYDAAGNYILDFTLNYNLKNDKIYKLRLNVLLSDGKEEITSPAYIISKRNSTPETNLTNNNFNLEKDFKTLVYDWLNNGNPKFFRSPAEGNYILRLMNISLAPNDTIGRMLHSFNATGYEIADCTVQELKEKQLIKFDNLGSNCDFINYDKMLSKKYIINLDSSEEAIDTYIPIIITNPLITGISYSGNKKSDTNVFILKKGEPYAQTNVVKDVSSSLNNTTKTIETLLGYSPDTSIYTLFINHQYFEGEINIKINDVNEEDTYNISIFDKIAKYSKIETITLKVLDDSSDPWKTIFYKYIDNNIQYAKQLERLYKIEEIKKYPLSSYITDEVDFINEVKRLMVNISIANFIYSDNKTLSTAIIQPSDSWTALTKDLKIEWLETEIQQLELYTDNANIDTITTLIINNIEFNDKLEILNITDDFLINITNIWDISNDTPLGCKVYFSNGITQIYSEDNEDSYRIIDFKKLKNYDQIIKIRPFKGTIIKFTGLISYATSPKLGQFCLGNSRLGDEYINDYYQSSI